MRGGLSAAALTALVLIGCASGALACTPAFPVKPRQTPFLALLANATAVVEARVIDKREFPLTAGEPITYVDLEVSRVLDGGPKAARLRVWSDVGIRSTCPTHNYLAEIKIGDDGIFAIRTVPVDGRLQVQAEHDIRTLIVAHAIERPGGELRTLGIPHDNSCPFGCAYYEAAKRDWLRAQIVPPQRR